MGQNRRRKRELMMNLYRVAKKIKLQNPDKSASDCIALAKQQLLNNKTDEQK